MLEDEGRGMARTSYIIVGVTFLCVGAGAVPVFVPPGTLGNIGHYLEQKRLAIRSHLPDMPDFGHDPGMDPASEEAPAEQGAFLSETVIADAPARQAAAKAPECADRGPRFQTVVPGEACGPDGLLKHGKEPPVGEANPGTGQ